MQQRQDESNYSSEPPSPDYYLSAPTYTLNQFASPEVAAMTLSPAPVTVYHPQYEDPSAASIDSLERTLLKAKAAVARGDFDDLHAAPRREGLALMPSAEFDDPTDSQAWAPYHQQGLYDGQPVRMPQPQARPAPILSLAPGYYENTAMSAQDQQQGPLPMTTFPTQIMDLRAHQGQMFGDEASRFFKQEHHSPNVHVDAANIALKSPPPSADLAARRSKPRPAALGMASLRDQSCMAARTTSHSPNMLRGNPSPCSPLRRIASAGGNMNQVSGRIQKAVTAPQRSPYNLHSFADADPSDQHFNFQRQGASNFTSAASSLAPPTPMSPHVMTHLKRDDAALSMSPEQDVAFCFTPASSTIFSPADLDNHLASPPGTPQAELSGVWSDASFPGIWATEPQWHFEQFHEPVYTPGFEGLPAHFQGRGAPNHYSFGAGQPSTSVYQHFALYPHDQMYHRQFEGLSPADNTLGDSGAEYHHAMSNGLPSEHNTRTKFTFMNQTAM